MLRKKAIAGLTLAALLLTALPLGPVQASGIIPSPHSVYVNGLPVTLNHSILYQGHTYVQLRDLASVTNMEVLFYDVDKYPSMIIPGGNYPTGININQPTFVYVREKNRDADNEVSAEPFFKGVDITGIYYRYRRGTHRYGFGPDDQKEHRVLSVPDGQGQKDIPIQVIYSEGKVYVTVDEFRAKIQPYLIDICMQ
ncbi:hypothetical protein [Peptococcus simiae]|uniref:hypothetical protein n=1 Tax=Peptococcus simiae TaxID=1643805 RepID=UPI003980E1F2